MERIHILLDALRDDERRQRLTVAVSASLAAGRILAIKFGTPIQIQHKGEIDLVTDADMAAQDAILEILGKGDAGTPILAEESSPHNGRFSAESLWVVDPLDGTTNFAHGFPWFAVSIAFACKGISDVGVIYAPLQNELFCAVRGAGAWLNGKKIQVSTTARLNESLLGTGFPYDVRQKPEPVLGALAALITKCQGLRRAGAAALDLAYVACGRLDGFWEIKLKPWDTAAGQLLVEEAGGRVTDFKGDTYSPLGEIAASNGLIHGELAGILSPYKI